MRIDHLEIDAYTVPTDRPESDGTLAWDATTLVTVHLTAAGRVGLGWSYGPAAIGRIVAGQLEDVVLGRDPFDVPAAWAAMVAAIRNAGPWGLAMYAVSAVDIALWDLKARLLDVALCRLLGRRRAAVPIYGSGGFCSYTDAELAAQLAGWAGDGIPRVKMKVGRDPAADVARAGVARAAIGPDVELMVDANGAWSPAEALRMAGALGELGVGWLEEPVSSDDLAGLRRVSDGAPAGMAVAAGEYATDPYAQARLLGAGAVDVLQADVTRCGGITGLLRADALCAAHGRDLSAHCAPNLAVHAMAAATRGRHLEYFHDHVRLEAMLFDGALGPVEGALIPRTDVPGHGLALRRADAERFRA